MKAKHIISEGHDYYYGKNPFDTEEIDIVKYEEDGKHYKIYYSGNYTKVIRKIENIEFDENEPLPEEYEKDDGKTKYYLRHENGEEINIDLTRYKPEEIPDELKAVYEQENIDQNIVNYERAKKQNPELDYNRIIDEANLTPEERVVAEAYIREIESELKSDKYLSLSDYSDIITNLPSIAKGKSIVVRHRSGDYSSPYDSIVSRDDILRGTLLADSGEHWDYAFGCRDLKSNAFSLEGRTEKLKDGREYKGTYSKQGYCIDVFVKDGEPYISPNLHVDRFNNQYFKGTLDLSLPIERFGIESGKEEDYKEYNDDVKAEKARRKNFYNDVMEDMMQTFDLSKEQAKILLEYAGTVTALKGATSLGKAEVPDKDLKAMLRKISYNGIYSISHDIYNAVGDMNFASMQASASTLLYLDYLLGGEEKRKDIVLETQGIDDELLDKFKELYDIKEKRETAEKLIASPKPEINSKSHRE